MTADAPLHTVTGAHRGELAIVSPSIVGCGGRRGQSPPVDVRRPIRRRRPRPTPAWSRRSSRAPRTATSTRRASGAARASIRSRAVPDHLDVAGQRAGHGAHHQVPQRRGRPRHAPAAGDGHRQQLRQAPGRLRSAGRRRSAAGAVHQLRAAGRRNRSVDLPAAQRHCAKKAKPPSSSRRWSS
jgi:hypothetical protein